MNSKTILLTRLFALFITIFSSSQVSAWKLEADFEKGSIGTEAQGDDGFSDAFTNTYYSNEKSHTGNKSAKSTIKVGTTGWPDFGGSFKFPTQLTEGKEVWIRLWVYYPTGFSFNCGGCTQGVKFMRVHTKSSSGTHEGYHSVLISSESLINVDNSLAGVTTELYQNNGPWPYEKMRNIGSKVTLGTWHAFEQYFKFSGTPGKGIYRVWEDGKLIFDDKLTRTLISSTSSADFIYIWTYWNEKASQTQSAYIDDVLITNERPSNLDSHGNPFIGVGNVKFIAPPGPPKIN